jgi:hypothetical protein
MKETLNRSQRNLACMYYKETGLLTFPHSLMSYFVFIFPLIFAIYVIISYEVHYKIHFMTSADV